MESLKNNTQNLSNISFPVFIIREHNNIVNEKGRIIVHTNHGEYIIDNRNLTGSSLGQRRLRINEKPKYILKKAIYTCKDLIKCYNKTFIDSKGKIFNYIKMKTVPLIYKRIVKRVGTIIYLKDINCPFSIPKDLDPDIKYAGVLKIDQGYLLYDLSYTFKKRTWRKI